MLRKSFFALSTILVSLLFLNCSKVDDFEENTPVKNDTIISEEFETIHNNQILSNHSAFGILKIIEDTDGFIIFSNVQVATTDDIAAIRISKIDNNFNEVWSFLINETDVLTESLFGVFDLPNNEFIAILNKGEYKLVGPRSTTYALKFNSSGTILWKKQYKNEKPHNPSDYLSHDLPIQFDNESNELKFMMRTDSLNITTHMADQYFNEITIDKDFNILKEEVLPYDATQGYLFDRIKYDELGNKYTYSGKYFIDYYVGTAAVISMQWYLMKYNLKNELVFEQDYGIERQDEILDRILLDNNKIIAIGKYGEKGNKNLHRAIFQINNNNGGVNWNIIEDNHLFSSNSPTASTYIGCDIKFDDDGNYLVLFNDGTSGGSQTFNTATLIKINKEGKIMWRFMDGEFENQDHFTPYNIFVKNNEYLIFGLKDNSKLWLKKIKLKL